MSKVCNESKACNTGSTGSCEFPPENYTCSGSWIGDYCGAASAYNTGSRAECKYSNGSDSGHPLCTTSGAYNKGSAGSCKFPEENYNCSGSSPGEYCGAASVTHKRGQKKNCAIFCSANRPCTPSCRRWKCDNCQNTSETNNEYPEDYVCPEDKDTIRIVNNMAYVDNMSPNRNNANIDADGNTITMTQAQLHELLNKIGDSNKLFQSYTSGQFQVNDRYYTTLGELISSDSSNGSDSQLIPGNTSVNYQEVEYKEDQQPEITYEAKTHTPFNYYYTQSVDPNVSYPYDTQEVPIPPEDTTYPFFNERCDRPVNFDGTSHTYMHPQNWKYPEKKAPNCKPDNTPAEPPNLDRNFTPLTKWDSPVGTILPGFNYTENNF